MEYNLGYSKNAVEQICALPKGDATIIISWLKKHAGFDPSTHGELIENLSSPAQAVKYNIGNYKIFSHVNYNQVIILSVIAD